MISFIQTHKLLSLILAVLILGGAWAVYSSIAGGGTESSSLLGTSTLEDLGTGSAVSDADRQLQETLAQVRSIQLNTPILSDPAFLSLQDIGQQIVSEPFGREDPFAPISPTQ